MKTRRNGIPGRSSIPANERRIQHTVTISQEAETIVQAFITRAGGARKANVSAFVDDCIRDSVK